MAVDEATTSITAAFEDGTSATADMLIGADGIHSTVRKLIDPSAPEPTVRWLARLGGEAEACTVPGPTDSDPLCFRQARVPRLLASAEWPSSMVCNLPHQPVRVDGRGTRDRQRTNWLARLREAYAGDVPAEELVREHTPGAAVRSRLHGHAARECRAGIAVGWCWWATQRSAPNHSSGQGVSLAVESAVGLARCLRDLDDPSAAFAAYEQLRRPRVCRVAAEAERTNQRKAAGPVASAVMTLLMRIAVKTFAKPEKMCRLGARVPN